ncbi:MAG: hypothetical protein ACYTDU_05790 [Planctomycetota bacterium]
MISANLTATEAADEPLAGEVRRALRGRGGLSRSIERLISLVNGWPV